MEFERLNEDTIRVMVTHEDLTDRDLSLMDLLGDQEEIERFFYSVLEEAELEDEFIDNEAVTFQVVPNKQGLELFISKNMLDPKMMSELLDGGEGARMMDEMPPEVLAHLMAHDTPKPATPAHAEAEVVDDMLDDITESVSDLTKKLLEEEQALHDPRQVMFKYADFEALVQAALTLGPDAGHSRAWHYQDAYYLSMDFARDLDQTGVRDLTAILREYGEVVSLSVEFLQEHAPEMFADADALAMIQHYFK